MAQHDQFHNMKAIQCREVDGEGLAVTATVTGVMVDTAGYDALTFLVDVGDNDGNAFDGTNKITYIVQEGPTADGVGAAEIVAGDYLGAKDGTGASWDRILDEATADNQVYMIGVRLNTTRYKRVVGTVAGTLTTVPVGYIAILGKPHHAPVV